VQTCAKAFKVSCAPADTCHGEDAVLPVHDLL
jgi:hypothetical protein